MNNQEFDRKMNFIIEQHARFAADLNSRQAREAEFDERHRVWKIEIEDILTRLARVTKEGFNDFNAKINALIDVQIRMEDQQRKTEELVRLNSEQQRKTDEQLRRTDQLLRRYLGGERNGGNN